MLTAAVHPSPSPNPMLSPMAAAAESFGKDAVVAWFRGEFAAANAIIDALCGHLAGFSGSGPGSEYETVFAAIHGRRSNWVPVIQMQSYHPIADVLLELRKVAGKKKTAGKVTEAAEYDAIQTKPEVKYPGIIVGDDCHEATDNKETTDSDNKQTTDSGPLDARNSEPTAKLCSNHEDCTGRMSRITLTKGFIAKVNVVKGLKLYEGIFTDSELLKLCDFVNELRVAGQNEQLSGETYVSFNKQVKGNRRELVQFGVPIFEHVSDDSTQTNELEPIPDLLQDVIDHLILWQLIPEYKRPNGAIIHYVDEDEYSQPFLKPPHLELPISTLVLSDATIAFGRAQMRDSEGNHKGPLMQSLERGSMLVMRRNSADLARHVLCPSPSKRVCIKFFRVRQACPASVSPPSQAVTLWQGNSMGMVPMEMVTCPTKVPQGTGVFLPWAVGARPPTKLLPPRAQRMRLQPLPATVVESGSELESMAKAVDG